jgi:hypothetical protein
MTWQKFRDPVAGDEARLRTRIRFVEFFGLPGIGKTTAANLLGKKLQQCNLAVDEDRAAYEKRTFVGRQLYRFGIISSQLADREFRRLGVRIARFVAEGGQATAIDLVREIWHLFYLSAYVREKRSGSISILVLDQGLLQGFWSVFLKSRGRRTSEDWLDILSSIGVDDIVFLHLRGDIDTAQRRLLKRGDQASRMQKTSPDGDLERWITADRACREMAANFRSVMRGAGRTGVLAAVDVDPLAPPDEVAQRALEGLLLACRDRLPTEAG